MNRLVRLACLLVLMAVALAGPTAYRTARAEGQLPALGADPSSVDLRSVPGAVPYGDKLAIPLKAQAPDWFTPELAQQVLASGGAPVRAPVDAPAPSEVGIRPGAWAIILGPEGTSACTMNFIFSKSSKTAETSYAIGTAGHCVDKNDSVVLVTVAPGGVETVLVTLGQIVVDSCDGDACVPGRDYALVKIPAAYHTWVDPTIAVIGGPCGKYTGDGPETVWHYGHGLAIGTGGTPRSGLALQWGRADYGWAGAAIFGDSGSPARVTALQAAGNVTHIGLEINTREPYVSDVFGTRIETIEGKGWTLLSSRLCL